MKQSLAWLVIFFVIRAQVTAGCLSTQFACSNGNCVPRDYQCNRYNDCADNSDEVGCVCYAGDIHLTGQGSSVTKGNVELCLQNQFLAICGNVWSSKDAKVVCRQLGYNNSIASNSSAFGPATTTFFWTNIAGGCTGTETYLYLCPRYPTSVSCTGVYPAAVYCSSPYCPSSNFQCTNGHCISTAFWCDGYNDCGDNSDETDCVCSRGMVRLVDGASSAEGTVEACFRNQWGTVCDTVWTAQNAKVVCGQLGFAAGSAVLASYYGPGSATVTWDDIGRCIGNESMITACGFLSPPVPCSMLQHAGVSCYDSSPTSAVIGGAVVVTVGGAIGGAIGGVLLCIICGVCIAICCIRKNRRLYTPIQHVTASDQMQQAAARPKVIIIQGRKDQPQPPMMPPPASYAPNPYQPYPAPPSYATAYNGMGAPEQYHQPLSYMYTVPQPYAGPQSYVGSQPYADSQPRLQTPLPSAPPLN